MQIVGSAGRSRCTVCSSRSQQLARLPRLDRTAYQPVLRIPPVRTTRPVAGVCLAARHGASVHLADARPTNTTAHRPLGSFEEPPFGSRIEPYVGPVAVHVAPGVGLGLFTTQAVVPGQLLLISQPLATVALRPTAVATGPSKLIQALLSELLNPGQRQWLQLLCDRDAIAQRQLQLQGEIAAGGEQGSRSTPDANPGSNFGPAIDLQQLQGLAAAGGQLDRLQMTPMQLADMVQECAYTLDPDEVQITAQLLMAAGVLDGSTSGSSGSSSSSSFSADKACCGLWPELALMGRSCAPNVSLSLVQEGLLLLRAAEYMPAGTQLFIPQLQPSGLLLKPFEQRQQTLLQGSGYSCGCSRCLAEAELAAQQPQLQPLLQSLNSTAAAAAAAMAHTAADAAGQGLGFQGDDWGIQDTNAQGCEDARDPAGSRHWERSSSSRPGSRASSPLQMGDQVLESQGGSAGQDGERDEYQGDDWMWGGAEAAPQTEQGLKSSRSTTAAGSNSSSSNRSSSPAVVVAAEYVPLDLEGSTCSTEAAAGFGADVPQQEPGPGQPAVQAVQAAVQAVQRREVALEWLQRLVADLLQLLSVSAAPAATAEEAFDQHLLVSAACHSSWAAVRQALVILNSNSSGSNGSSSSSSSEQLLATQLQYLLTRADLARITSHASHNGSGLSWQQLLVRVYDLELQTLAAVAPGSLDHVLLAAAAATATAAAATRSNPHDKNECDQPSAASVAGGFINAVNHAVVAKFGSSLGLSAQQELLKACRAVAAAEGLVPPDAVAAAAGLSATHTAPATSGSSSSSGNGHFVTPAAAAAAATAAAECEPDSVQGLEHALSAEQKQKDSGAAEGLLPADAVRAGAETAAAPAPPAVAAAADVLEVVEAEVVVEPGAHRAAPAAAAAAASVQSVADHRSNSMQAQDISTAAAAAEEQDGEDTAVIAAEVEVEVVVEAESLEVESSSSSSSRSNTDTCVDAGRSSTSSNDGRKVYGEAKGVSAATAAAAAEMTSAVEASDTTTAAAAVAGGTSAAGGADIAIELESSDNLAAGQSNNGGGNNGGGSNGNVQDSAYGSSSSTEAPKSAGAAAAAAAIQDKVSSGGDGRWSVDGKPAAAAAAAQAATPPPSWLSAAARAAANAACRSSSPAARSSSSAASSSSSRSSSPAVNLSADGDDLLDSGWTAAAAPPPAAAEGCTLQAAAASSGDSYAIESNLPEAPLPVEHFLGQQQQQQGLHEQQAGVDVSGAAAMLTQPWQRGPPASWVKTTSTENTVDNSDLGGDDFDFLSPSRPVSPATAAAAAANIAPQPVQQQQQQWQQAGDNSAAAAAAATGTVDSTPAAAAEQKDGNTPDPSVAAEAVVLAAPDVALEAEDAALAAEEFAATAAADDDNTPGAPVADTAVGADLITGKTAGTPEATAAAAAAAAEGAAVAENAAMAAADVAPLHASIPLDSTGDGDALLGPAGASDDVAAAAAGQERAAAAVDGQPEAAAAVAGSGPLPAAAAEHLLQLLKWTEEVSGPLSQSQQALVQQLVQGSSNTTAAASSGLDAEQVQLLRQLLGLVG